MNSPRARVVQKEHLAFYEEHGYVHVPKVFNQDEVKALRDELAFLLDTWAITAMGWSGDWRKEYMDEETEKKSKLTHLHDLQLYSEAWNNAVNNPILVNVLSDVLGPNVEFHHTTLHLKPPQTGHPFPMHQDMAFYEHENDQYVDVLLHLDDTCHENGEIRFIDGSHKWGYLQHLQRDSEGRGCTPYLPTDKYTLEDSVPVPAKAGDVVLFNVNTIHGSHINQTPHMRRMIRMGYRNPENKQFNGQSCTRPGRMVAGRRPLGCLAPPDGER